MAPPRRRRRVGIARARPLLAVLRGEVAGGGGGGRAAVLHPAVALRAGASVPLGRRVEADAGLQAAPPPEMAPLAGAGGGGDAAGGAGAGAGAGQGAGAAGVAGGGGGSEVWGGGGGGGAEGELTEAAGGGGRTEDEDGGECGRDTVRRSGRRLPGGDGRVRYALRDAAEGGAMAGRPGD